MRALARRGLAVGAVLGLLWATACGDDDQKRLKGYGVVCGSTSDCAASLTCRYQRCRDRCEKDSECDIACLRDAAHPVGVCAVEEDRGCAASGCIPGMACGADDLCRPECTSPDDCATGDTCSQNACGGS